MSEKGIPDGIPEERKEQIERMIDLHKQHNTEFYGHVPVDQDYVVARRKEFITNYIGERKKKLRDFLDKREFPNKEIILKEIDGIRTTGDLVVVLVELRKMKPILLRLWRKTKQNQ